MTPHSPPDAKRPLVAVTMGDPAGVGPELCLRLLTHTPSHAHAIPLIFGDQDVLNAVAERCALPAPERVIDLEAWTAHPDTIEGPTVLHLPACQMDALQAGRCDAMTGRASYTYILQAIEAAQNRQVAAVTTGPIHKEALHAAEIPYPGHTEIFTDKTGAGSSCMMLTSELITCSFVTAHVGYHEVPQLLTIERILEVIQLTHDAMQRIRGRRPRLLACGLNPHAGEHGLFGQSEEERIIAPAIAQAQAQGIDIEGPLPPDTVFLPKRRASMDAFICMYHDQGHIPLKALAFDQAINVTLGLPIIRTSVDHGTATDIAWQGLADPNSLYEAFALAARLATS